METIIKTNNSTVRQNSKNYKQKLKSIKMETIIKTNNSTAKQNSKHLNINKIIKRSVITKEIGAYTINENIITTHKPQMGDIAVFEVVGIGKHKSILGLNGHAQYIFEGDRIMAAFGTRYASNQFEGYVPNEIKEEYDILAQGGVIGELKSMHSRFERVGTTRVKLIGYAVNKSNLVVNTISQFKANNISLNGYKNPHKRDYKIYLSVGASMDSGKTTTAAFFSRGAAQLGKKVAYIKLTGTVHSKDGRYVNDCGASISVDFSNCGYPSTFTFENKEILGILDALLKKVEKINPDIVIIEIADGLLQRETYNLIGDDGLMKQVDGGVLLSCGDSLAIKSGIEILNSKGISPICVAGMFTTSPLMIEEVKSITNVPVFSSNDFLSERLMEQLIN